jgi:hypothetical protein
MYMAADVITVYSENVKIQAPTMKYTPCCEIKTIKVY